ncbi:hypothetical protein [Streptomyces roseolus]|uniref:hypothetical protein n=1 Tax=Streptomyces roseolus TaxID=67358 RepID=UPI0036E4845D
MVDLLGRIRWEADEVHGAIVRVLRQQPAPLPVPAQFDDQVVRVLGAAVDLLQAAPEMRPPVPHHQVGWLHVPFRGRRLAWWQRRHHGTHAEVRCVGERTVTTSKGRRLVRRFRCSAKHVTSIVRAFLVLRHASA